MTKKTTTLEQASQLIRSSCRPLLLCHIAPDGDAIGSLTGLGRALRRLGQEPTTVCTDSVPAQFDFVPGAASIVQEATASFDLVITLDCSDLERLGHFPRMPAFASTPLINVDHHLTNVYFGDVNLVDTDAASTAGLVLQLLDHLVIPLDAELATSLLVGIATDTRGLRTSNVTISVMESALRLMKNGASLPYITQHTLDRRHIATIRLWGAALPLLQLEDGVIWTSITLAMRRAVDYAGGGDAGLVNFLVSADAADAAVVFVERDDEQVDVGLRAVPGFDVAQVALQLGGGGHVLASGCTLSGSLEEIREQVLAALRADLTRQRQNYA